MHRRKLLKTSKFKTNKNLTTFLKRPRLISLLSFANITRVLTEKKLQGLQIRLLVEYPILAQFLSYSIPFAAFSEALAVEIEISVSERSFSNFMPTTIFCVLIKRWEMMNIRPFLDRIWNILVKIP